MSAPDSALFVGRLLHRRYQPLRHALAYDVAHLFVDIDELPAISRRSWLFGYQQKKLFSVQDRNHGYGDGTPVAQHVRSLMAKAKTAMPISRVFMFCYPAVLGKVFNPLTVYFGYDTTGRLAGLVYEVSNTFGQRHAYLIAVAGAESHAAEKQFYVSPFNPASGEYRFSCALDQGHLRLNIALFEQGQLKLCARFEGEARPLNDKALLASAFLLALQPLKVVCAIHWQALKLYLKGLRPQPRPAHPPYAVSLPKVKP